ncbi:MAG: O-antigen ligase family protein [Planctomycetes bacterium]|nr:O-antigen ligase family protein [Planctomycetota bacterium]
MSLDRPLAWTALLVASAAPWAFGSVDPSWAAALAVGCLVPGALMLLADVTRRHPAAVPRGVLVAAMLVVAVPAIALVPLPHAVRTLVAHGGTTLMDRVAASTSSGWRPSSLAPAATGTALGLAAAYVAAFALLRREAGRPGGRQAITAALSISGVGLAVIGVWQHVTQLGELRPKIYWRWQVYEAGTPFGPYVNRNHFAGAMAVLACVAAGEALASWSLRRRAVSVVYAAAVATMLGALATTTSRGGVIAAGTGALFLLACAPRGRRLRGALLIASAVAAAGAALFWTGALDAFTARIATLSGRWKNRFGVQRDAILAFLDNPIFGTGAGTFEDVYPPYQRVCDERSFQNAHSDWAQVLMETGLLGLAALIAVWREFAAWVRSGIAASGASRWRTLGPAAGVAAVVAHGFVEVNLHVPANALLTVCALSLASAAVGGDTADGSSTRGPD